MHFFSYKAGRFCAENVPVERIAEQVGTPLYIYSYNTFARHFQVFDGSFKDTPHITCYSCKANPNLSLLKTISALGGGVDIVSGGELYAALSVSIPPDKIVFSGVGKTEEEIAYAVRSRIAMINVESEDELIVAAQVGKRLRREVPVSIRVNPEIDAKTHPYITTGLKKNKFGLLWGDARRLYDSMAADRWLQPVGISSHIGSQITEIAPFLEAVQSLKRMTGELRQAGIALRYIDIGGGLGITYKNELPPQPGEYARAIAPALKGTDLTLILEPGRVIVGNSGIFVTRVLYVKKTGEKTFYIVDGAMNDLVRPALYDAYHEIVPVRETNAESTVADVVGPVCESGDFLAKGRKMAALEPGALIAVMSAGAYGYSMSSNYNLRKRVPEILVKDDNFYIVRKRERNADLLRGQSIPEFLETRKDNG
jgi:diaminopimelate decarboxylase